MTASARRLCILVLLALSSSGCMFIDAGARELDDHGSHAKYEHQSYGAHFGDALGDALAADDDDDDRCEPPPCRTEVRVYVDHHPR